MRATFARSPSALAARAAMMAGLIATLVALSGCDRVRVHGSGGSSSKPDIGVGVEF